MEKHGAAVLGVSPDENGKPCERFVQGEPAAKDAEAPKAALGEIAKQLSEVRNP